MSSATSTAHSGQSSEAGDSLKRSGRARIVWLDAAKGLGILLVVLGHSLGGIIDSPQGRGLEGFRLLFSAVYLFHMPLFFLLSGLLVQRRLANSQAKFGSDLLVTIVWPYFLWSTIQYSFIYLAGTLVNSPVSHFWPTILKLPIASTAQFWFLYVLFLLHAAALLFVPRIGALAFLILIWMLKFALPWIHPPLMIHLMIAQGGFYALGLWAGTGGIQTMLDRLGNTGRAALIVAACAAVVYGTFQMVEDKGAAFIALRSFDMSALAWRIQHLPAAFLGLFAVIVLADTARGGTAQALAWIGQRSMAIYVLHVLFIAGLRILLIKLHLHNAVLLELACYMIGVAAPLVLTELARRFANSRLLGLG